MRQTHDPVGIRKGRGHELNGLASPYRKQLGVPQVLSLRQNTKSFKATLERDWAAPGLHMS